MSMKCPHCGKVIPNCRVASRIGRRRLNINSQTICETLSEQKNVKKAAYLLNCSVGYIYKVLKPLKLNPSKIARGEIKKWS